MTKTYIITGSASGIGRGVLEKLYADNIVFAGYRNSAHNEVLKSISPNIYPFYVDYSKPETIKQAADYIKSKCTKIDTLINIAGCVVAGPVEKLVMDEVRRQFDVNVLGHIELAQNLVEIMDGGKIINVSSMASYGLFPFISPYCASKRALDMFFNSFMIENKKNIKVISIKPGVIKTPLWEKSIEENSRYFEQFEEYSKEMEYISKNAKKNETCGLSVDKVVSVILRADRAIKPKLSYTVGADAYCAHLISKLPQGLVNSLIKCGIKHRMK